MGSAQQLVQSLQGAEAIPRIPARVRWFDPLAHARQTFLEYQGAGHHIANLKLLDQRPRAQPASPRVQSHYCFAYFAYRLAMSASFAVPG